VRALGALRLKCCDKCVAITWPPAVDIEQIRPFTLSSLGARSTHRSICVERSEIDVATEAGG